MERKNHSIRVLFSSLCCQVSPSADVQVWRDGPNTVGRASDLLAIDLSTHSTSNSSNDSNGGGTVGTFAVEEPHHPGSTFGVCVGARVHTHTHTHTHTAAVVQKRQPGRRPRVGSMQISPHSDAHARCPGAGDFPMRFETPECVSVVVCTGWHPK